jgi:hypothetical protein
MLVAERPGGVVPFRAVTPLNGITWQGFGLIALLFGLWSLHWVLTPNRMGLVLLDGTEIISTWFAFWISMLVGGECLYVVIVILLNVAAGAGYTRAWIVAPIAAGGCMVAAVLTGLVGAAPTGLLQGGADASSGVLFWADWASAIAVGYLVLRRLHKSF